jgi:hypothetical protein
MIRLSRAWRAAREAGGIVLFDQAFVQAIYTFVLSARAADTERIGHAIDVVPEPDLVVRLDAPLQVLESRLAKRRCHQGRIERLFDCASNLGSAWVFDQLDELLRVRGRPVILIDSTDRRSLGESADEAAAVIEGLLPRSAAERNGAA